MPRLFFAFRPSDAVLLAAEAEISRLDKGDADVRWLGRDHLHVTLRFLGDVDADRVSAVAELLESACRSVPVLDLEARGIGTFPRWPKPRVIWVAIVGRNEESGADLQRLRAHLDRGATALGIPSDDKGAFTPHLTLGRVRSPRNFPSLDALIGAAYCVLGSFQVAEILLIQSRLTPRGSVYTTLARGALQPRVP